MNVKKKETTGHQRQQDIINVARRVTMLMNIGQLEQGDVAEMTAFLLDLGVMTVKKYYRFELDHVGTPGKKRNRAHRNLNRANERNRSIAKRE